MKKLLPILFFLPQLLWAQHVTHGPVSGGITHNSARVYVRTGYVGAFTLEVDDDSTFTSPLSFNITADPLRDSSVVTDIPGLTSNTYYYARFVFAGVPDVRKGRFKTFPQPGEKTNFTLVTGSCQETPDMNTFDRMAEINPLMMFHLGDFTYPSYELDDTYPANYSTVQLSWRKRYEEHRTREMLWTVPIDYINDDDDGYGSEKNLWISPEFTYDSSTFHVHNYYSVDTIPLIGRYNHNRAYCEYFPHYPLVDTSLGLFHSYVMGNTEIFFLDTRSMADPVYESFVYDSINDSWSFGPDTSHSILGDYQMSWLKQGLLNSTADWKLIFCGLPFNKNLKKLIHLGVFFQNSMLDIDGSPQTGMKLATSFAGYWPGYPADQQELLDFMEINQIKNVMISSGDTHHNMIDDGYNAGIPELNASGLSVADRSLGYQLNHYLEPLGFPVVDSLWNKGGNGLAPDTNLNNAFGRIDVYKGDSLKVCVVDEYGVNIACMTIVNSSIASIQQEKTSVFSKVYPNPTSGDLHVLLNPDYKFTKEDNLYLVNTLGKKIRIVAEQLNNDEHQFVTDLRGLAAGVYYLIFESPTTRMSHKVVVK